MLFLKKEKRSLRDIVLDNSREELEKRMSGCLETYFQSSSQKIPCIWSHGLCILTVCQNLLGTLLQEVHKWGTLVVQWLQSRTCAHNKRSPHATSLKPVHHNKDPAKEPPPKRSPCGGAHASILNLIPSGGPVSQGFGAGLGDA